MAKLVWDAIRNIPLKLENELAHNELDGSSFAYNLEDEAEFIPLMECSYLTIITGLSHWLELNQTEPFWLKEVNAELIKYGV
ncbi:hypothetical protein [Bacillus salipaludis]|uniref:hypothetical protein n=1 Tax=Bacillus salipaludis TaxID=2547811 RepID=UPI002E1EA8D2|nr:hypothetical protein [Bacillus salipaludis]